MNAASARTLWNAAAAAAVLVLGAGALWGGLVAGSGGSAAPRDEQAVRAARGWSADPALGLRVLGSHAHWGRYTPPPESAGSAPVPQTPVRARGADVIGSYRLVGIESQGGQRRALLLPTDRQDAELVRASDGDSLGEGLTVRAVGSGSLTVDTAGGETTLHLYGDSQ